MVRRVKEEIHTILTNKGYSYPPKYKVSGLTECFTVTVDVKETVKRISSIENLMLIENFITA
jgi:hypothetical protein